MRLGPASHLMAMVSVFLLGSSLYGRGIPTECGDDKECLIELPGSTCADGTPSFITLTKRAGAKNVLIYLTGGGGCWSKDTCQSSYVHTLTRKEEPTDWTAGEGIHDNKDPRNAFARDFDVITVPYCTGDVHIGNRTIDYGKSGTPYVIRHQGNQNVQLALKAVKALYPSPEKVALVGCSAGGIGVTYHLRNLAANYPDARKYVVSDAGTPFHPPYVNAKTYEKVMSNWGAILPTDPATGQPVKDLAEITRFNTKQFADIRFGFISSYRDKTMTFFSWALGASSPLTAVKKTIVDVSDNYLGRDSLNAKVFYTETDVHCHTPNALSGGLSSWLEAMVHDGHGWDNERPDLH